MSQVVAILLLMMFFIPACLSLLFASRNPLAILWNFGWYYLMAQLGEIATQNSNGKYLGMLFGILYVLRIFSSTGKRMKTQTFAYNTFNIRPPRGFTPPPSYSQNPTQATVDKNPAQVTLDAEFERR